MCIMKNRKQQPDPVGIEFMRTTITLPAELQPFVEMRKSAPEHAGNMSAYVRSLILQDRKALDSEKPA